MTSKAASSELTQAEEEEEEANKNRLCSKTSIRETGTKVLV